jgi:hypothetical protein
MSGWVMADDAVDDTVTPKDILGGVVNRQCARIEERESRRRKLSTTRLRKSPAEEEREGTEAVEYAQVSLEAAVDTKR